MEKTIKTIKKRELKQRTNIRKKEKQKKNRNKQKKIGIKTKKKETGENFIHTKILFFLKKKLGQSF